MKEQGTEQQSSERGERMLLVVEDEPLVRTTAKRALERFGYRVVLAANADEALRKLASHPVELVLSDVTLPGVDGIELSRRLRAERPSLPVVLMSGRDLSGLTSGRSFVSKPFSLSSLRTAVRDALAEIPEPA